VNIALADHSLVLLPERAVWWPALGTAVIADVHLGKDQVFRRSGVAIPASVLEAELASLDALIATTGCERLLVLGDWVHAPPADGELWPDRIATWRKRHGQLAVDLVLGNHDRSLSRWLVEWRISAYREPYELEGLSLFHEVDPAEPAAGMSGHFHPVARLRSRRECLRLPAFARRGDHLVLPAFGRFTGGHDGLEHDAYALYAVAGRRVVDVSGRAAGRAL
jgi:DNA ligase-associated metallophosphoesterase